MKPIKHTMLCLLLLVYAGQSVTAVAAPCLMMGEAAPGAVSDMGEMAHAGHHMDASGAAAMVQGGAGCCDSGLCTMSQCQSAAALLQTRLSGSIGFVSLYGISSLPFADTPSVDSLYRPPISR